MTEEPPSTYCSYQETSRTIKLPCGIKAHAFSKLTYNSSAFIFPLDFALNFLGIKNQTHQIMNNSLETRSLSIADGWPSEDYNIFIGILLLVYFCCVTTSVCIESTWWFISNKHGFVQNRNDSASKRPWKGDLAVILKLKISPAVFQS